MYRGSFIEELHIIAGNHQALAEESEIQEKAAEDGPDFLEIILDRTAILLYYV